MIRYAFRDDGPTPLKGLKKLNANRIGGELAAIAAGSSGRLTPKAVVDFARDNPRSNLHKVFEWNDGVAAAKYRLEQARSVIRIVRVVDEEGEEPIRAFLSVGEGRGGTSYRAASEVQGSRELQLLVLKQALRDLRAWRLRYRDLQEICQLVDVAEEKLQERVMAQEGHA